MHLQRIWEKITEESNEPEILGTLDNIAKSIVTIYKQLKKTTLEMQTTSNMLMEVICKIDYREEATLLEKC